MWTLMWRLMWMGVMGWGILMLGLGTLGTGMLILILGIGKGMGRDGGKGGEAGGRLVLETSLLLFGLLIHKLKPKPDLRIPNNTRMSDDTGNNNTRTLTPLHNPAPTQINTRTTHIHPHPPHPDNRPRRRWDYQL